MQRTATRAGGCFLTLFILSGLAVGLLAGNPMIGVVLGTIAGAATAMLIWLIDRRRTR